MHVLAHLFMLPLHLNLLKPFAGTSLQYNQDSMPMVCALLRFVVICYRAINFTHSYLHYLTRNGSIIWLIQYHRSSPEPWPILFLRIRYNTWLWKPQQPQARSESIWVDNNYVLKLQPGNARRYITNRISVNAFIQRRYLTRYPNCLSFVTKAHFVFYQLFHYRDAQSHNLLNGPIDNKSYLVRVTAWRRFSVKPLPDSVLLKVTDAYMLHPASSLMRAGMVATTRYMAWKNL